VAGRLVDVKMISSLRRCKCAVFPVQARGGRQMLEYRRYSASLQAVPDGFNPSTAGSERIYSSLCPRSVAMTAMVACS